MATKPAKPTLISGRYFSDKDLKDIKEMVRLFPKLSRTELAGTICEYIGWFTATGQPKIDSCYQLFNKLEGDGQITLPPRAKSSAKKEKKKITFSSATEAGLPVEGTVSDLEPLTLKPLRDSKENRLWNEYVHRYHTLGYKRPFGAHQRYFIFSEKAEKPLGCILFAAAAWALFPRDQWIGWDTLDRHFRLQLILNNSRFLIFPWVRVKNLASKALSLAAKRVREDWYQRYGYRPVLLETFVDTEKYHGTCYQAANWIYLGQTKGRGRMDRNNEKTLSCKAIYVYPLTGDFRAFLRGDRHEATASPSEG